MKTDAIKHAMYFGLLLGLLFSVNFWTQASANAMVNSLQLVFVFLIPYVVFVVMKHCRDNVFDGRISYRKAFFYGIQLFFYASVVSAAFKYVYFKFIDPTYLKNLKNASMKVLESLNYSTSEELLLASEEVFTPINMSLQFIWTNMFLGVFLLIVLSAIVKKEQKEIGE